MLSTAAILFWLFTALSLCDAQTQSAPEAFSDSAPATIASEIFQRYEDALNRHDADAVAAFWALNTEGSVQRAKTRAVLAHWKGYREFEAATHAVFHISWKSLGANAFEVTQREECVPRQNWLPSPISPHLCNKKKKFSTGSATAKGQ